MRNIVVLPSFDRSAKKLSHAERRKFLEVMEKFNRFLLTGEMGAGLGFKKVNHDNFEFRIDIRLRVVFKQTREEIYLVLVGSHDDVKKYLRAHRNA